jgi:PKHD-type hydroxylase
MRGEWCFFKSHFDPSTCQHILDLGLTIPAQDAKLGVDGDAQNNETRRSKIRFIQRTDTRFEFLFTKLWNLALWANDDWFDFHLSRISYLQLAEYDSSYTGEYRRHHDVFWMNKDPKYHRKLTCVVQLSDPSTYTGGDFQMYNIEQHPIPAEIRTQGSVIFLPSFVEHSAQPVTSGTRYSIAAWFDGPKWK